MGRYFKIIDNTKEKPRTRHIEAPRGSQLLFCYINEIVGTEETWFGVPYSIEVDGWGEDAAPGDVYEHDDDKFIVECLSEEEWN